MKIYLMRHGETDWNKERRMQGWTDIPLNEFGLDLARKTAEGLKDVTFDAVFSSPLQRASVTANMIAANSNMTAETDRRLLEINFGIGDGQCFDQPKKDPNHPLHDFFMHPEKYIPADGAESFQDALARLEDFFREKVIPLEGSCENVLVVAHGALNRCLLNKLEGNPMEDFWNIALPNCAVSILSCEDGKLSIMEESKVYYEGAVNGRP